MGFPSGKIKDTLTRAFQTARSESRNIKQRAIDIRDKSLAGAIARKEIMEFPTHIADALDVWNSARALLGIGQYAKDQLDDEALTIGPDFIAMITACEGARDWIINNFPKQGNWLLERSFDADGRMVLGTLTAVQTAGLRAELNALIATIDD